MGNALVRYVLEGLWKRQEDDGGHVALQTVGSSVSVGVGGKNKKLKDNFQQ